MAEKGSHFASMLRSEIGLRNRKYAQGRLHVESYGGAPVVVYVPDHPVDEDVSAGTPARACRHGNFFDAAYAAMQARPEWMRRFNKIHAQGRSLPRPVHDPSRKWRELDSSMSSDALLMNVFCTPGVMEAPAVRRALGVDSQTEPVFGWRARVPLKSGRFDRTEVDMRWGGLLVEAKLTEGDFQSCKAAVVETYRDFDVVFERELLPRLELRTARVKEAVEFPEEFTQEFEAPVEDAEVARVFQAEIVRRAIEAQPVDAGYASYQLIRNVLAAYAEGESFCVVHDERRPDLREAWFQVMAAVKSAEMRVRCKVMTWQELTPLLPEELQEFLDVKYGIVGAGRRLASAVD